MQKGLVGIEPFFAVGVLSAALTSIAISQLYSAAAVALTVTVWLVSSLIHNQTGTTSKTSEILIVAIASSNPISVKKTKKKGFIKD